MVRGLRNSRPHCCLEMDVGVILGTSEEDRIHESEKSGYACAIIGQYDDLGSSLLREYGEAFHLQSTDTKNSRNTNLPSHRHLQTPDKIDRHTQHGNITQ